MGYASRTIEEFLDELGAATPAPASGTATALAAAFGAALVELAAGVSKDDSAVERARTLRARLVELADEDADAYAAFLRTRSDADRERTIEVPRELCRVAEQVAALGQEIAEHGKSSVVGDALSGAELARAAVRNAAQLVELNVAG
jgi:formiminotetrahydrofolate cyclodeaminase